MKYQRKEVFENKEGIGNTDYLLSRAMKVLQDLESMDAKITKLSVEFEYESDKEIGIDLKPTKDVVSVTPLTDLRNEFHGSLITMTEGFNVRDQCSNFFDVLYEYSQSIFAVKFDTHCMVNNIDKQFISGPDHQVNIELLQLFFDTLELPFRYISGKTIKDLIIVNTKAEESKKELIYSLQMGTTIDLKNSTAKAWVSKIEESFKAFYMDMYKWYETDLDREYSVEGNGSPDDDMMNILLWRNSIPYKIKFKNNDGSSIVSQI